MCIVSPGIQHFSISSPFSSVEASHCLLNFVLWGIVLVSAYADLLKKKLEAINVANINTGLIICPVFMLEAHPKGSTHCIYGTLWVTLATNIT